MILAVTGATVAGITGALAALIAAVGAIVGLVTRGKVVAVESKVAAVEIKVDGHLSKLTEDLTTALVKIGTLIARSDNQLERIGSLRGIIEHLVAGQPLSAEQRHEAMPADPHDL